MRSARSHPGNSPRVQRTLRSLHTLEANAGVAACGADAPAMSPKKAAQKLTNFRAYLHKSSVAACFVDLLEMTNDGIMTESGLYPSSLYKKSRDIRRGGFSPSGGSRKLTARAGSSPGKADTSNARAHSGLDDSNGGRVDDCPSKKGWSDSPTAAGSGSHKHRRRRPSTATETPKAGLAQFPELPLTSRVPTRFAERADDIREGGLAHGGIAAAAAAVASRGANETTKLEIKRTQWSGVEGESAQRSENDVVDRSFEVGPVTNEVGPDAEAEDDGYRDDGVADSPIRSCVDGAPRAMIAWGEVARELTTTVSKVVQMKAVMHKKKALSSEHRLARAAKMRSELIDAERRKAEIVLSKNDDRKKAALEAAALDACQRGLLEAVMIVVAARRIWAAGMKLSVHREDQARMATAAKIVQRAFKAHSYRRMFNVLLSIRKVHMRLHIGICIRRKALATTKIRWFLATGSGGAKARPRMVVKAFMYQVRRCQRAAKEWLVCRAASIEAICRLWDRIEAEIRRELGDELDRAKRVWARNSLRTGQDGHMHGQWRALKAKTRSLVARLDRLEMRLEKQQKRDKAHRVLAARAMLKHRPEGPRGGKRLDQVDSAEDLRSSTVASSTRQAIIRSNLNTKFSLHSQSGRRVERTGNRVAGEMEARMLINGELEDGTENTGEGASAPSTKRSRALIYTGDLGRPWQQIVEDAVMQDFRRTAFSRKDSMPYLEYSVILSIDGLDVIGNEQGPSAAIAAAAVNAATNGSENSSATPNGSKGRGGVGNVSNAKETTVLEERRMARQKARDLADGSTGPARLALEPIIG